jgi:hypothetical protein
VRINFQSAHARSAFEFGHNVMKSNCLTFSRYKTRRCKAGYNKDPRPLDFAATLLVLH